MKTLSKNCINHDERAATDAILIEGAGIVSVCRPCKDEFLMADRWYCKHCGVAVKSKEDTTPVLRKSHKQGCPRAS